MKSARQNRGSVVWNNRFGTWNFLWVEDGRRHSRVIGTLAQYKTKAAASAAAEALRQKVVGVPSDSLPTVRTLVQGYRKEQMSERFSTRYSYNQWLDNHVLPTWGDCRITALQPRPVELWLKSLPIAPKSRAHVRGLLRQLWDYAMWRGDMPVQRNPIELVKVRGATKSVRKPRSLTVEQFQKFVSHLEEPFRTMALVSVCFGLRISECLALKWSDVDWLGSKLSITRAIVRQRVDAVKTECSERAMAIDTDMLALLRTWKQGTQFGGDDDWIFASPIRIGRLPWSYPWVWNVFQKAGAASGIGKLGTHTMRHSYRSWLDAVGTGIAVQQKLMRHADIRTTMKYGDVVTNEMSEAHTKVVRLALPRAN